MQAKGRAFGPFRDMSAIGTWKGGLGSGPASEPGLGQFPIGSIKLIGGHYPHHILVLLTSVTARRTQGLTHQGFILWASCRVYDPRASGLLLCLKC